MRALSVVLAAALLAACISDDDAPPDPGAELPDRRLDGGAGEGGTNGVHDATVPDGGDAQASCAIPLDATVPGTLKISVDDSFELYVNGALVKKFAGLWSSPQTEAVTLFRHPSKKNVIAIEAANAQNAAGVDRMVVVDLAFDAGSGVEHVVSDATWTRGPGGLETNWFAVDFAEANWLAATVQGSHGDAPYGAVLGASNAKYIWSYDSGAVDPSAKPSAETVWFRKSFSLACP